MQPVEGKIHKREQQLKQIQNALKEDMQRAKRLLETDDFSTAELAFRDAATRCAQAMRISNELADMS